MIMLIHDHFRNAGCRESDVSPAAGTQLCSGCGDRRKSAMFAASSSRPSGRHYQCKPCDSLSHQRRFEKNAVERESQPPPAAKRCPKCRQTYPSSEFNLCAGMRDGLQSKCRACDGQSSLVRQLRRKPHIGASLPLATAGTERFCRHCNKSKPWAEFKRDTCIVYGIAPICKECINGRRARKMWFGRLRKAGE